MNLLLPLWQRLVITVVAMLATSYLTGLIWMYATGWTMPGYIAGVIGGLTALPVWELLKHVRPSQT
ncbi:hypothetical protein [Breoghania sp. L-A4]|uniref:hypothetical protein n=1 Tax=Breoghania sp. L-A4 TaxID=2304600 RepID=UPI000E35956A|nr:hypothetical protein [Breoghania sp. L-A4]AXS40344.1 hypothetical protein D1F64_10095 [Breoghania sp. L-A4]